MSADATPYRSHLTRPRLGMHYFPDSLHFRECDLLTWLPELKSLGAAWLTLLAPSDRAIPEPFLKGLLKAGIEPILHFHLPLTHEFDSAPLKLLFEVYSRWGVRYVVLFDRPNQRDSWPPTAWAQSDLVERFLDLFLPVAGQALTAGLVPVFPPLQPGGDYWDTSFLQAALQGIQRRLSGGSSTQADLLDKLHLSAYAWADGHAMDWGAGGPERWPGVRPYFTPEGQQDQCGFHIFDWYLAHAQAALGAPLPILILAAGQRLGTSADDLASEAEELEHAAANRAIAVRLSSGAQLNPPGEPISPYVLACNFWLLASEPGDPQVTQAWFQPDGYSLAVVDVFRQLASHQSAGAEADAVEASQPPVITTNNLDEGSSEQSVEGAHQPEGQHLETPPDGPEELEVVDQTSAWVEEELPASPEPTPNEEAPIEELSSQVPAEEKSSSTPSEPSGDLPIAHYLLLPLPDSGAAEWLLEAARPYMLKYHPTTGYSPDEAALAQRVTVVGGEQVFSEDLLASLRSRGCQVVRIAGDGTEIATQLETQ